MVNNCRAATKDCPNFFQDVHLGTVGYSLSYQLTKPQIYTAHSCP